MIKQVNIFKKLPIKKKEMFHYIISGTELFFTFYCILV